MATVFNIDHKLIAIPVVAATAVVAIYSTGRLWALHRRQKKENVFETAKLHNNYLHLHYGSPKEIMKWDFGPKSDLEFPKRVAELCGKYCTAEKVQPLRALDVGCAVGRSAFELTRFFNEVIGIDSSKSFIDICNLLKEKGYMKYSIVTEGEIAQNLEAVVDKSIDRSKVTFQRGDACNLALDIGEFECVLASMLICHLPSPREFLDRLPNLVSHGGILVVVSTYVHHKHTTPKENWLGGWATRDGTPVTGFDGLIEHLSPSFELLTEEDMPLIIRDTDRFYRWIVTHITVWRRK